MIILNIFAVVPSMLLYEGMRVGNVSLVGTIAACFGAVSVILSVIFLGDHLRLAQMLVIILIFVGLLLSSLDMKILQKKKILSDKGVIYGLGAMILSGVYWTFIRLPVRQVGWFWPSYTSILGVPFLLLFYEVSKNQN